MYLLTRRDLLLQLCYLSSISLIFFHSISSLIPSFVLNGYFLLVYVISQIEMKNMWFETVKNPSYKVIENMAELYSTLLESRTCK